MRKCMRAANLWLYICSCCFLPCSLFANSAKSGDYKEVYAKCVTDIADSMLADQRRELEKLSATPVDFTSYEKMPRLCVIKELLPEKMQAAVSGIKEAGVLFDLGSGFSVNDAANMLGKRVLMRSGASLALDGCDFSSEVAEEMRRRIKGESKRADPPVASAPLVAARDGCQARADFSPEVQQLIPPTAGFSGIQIYQGTSSDACSHEPPGCKLFSKSEFERMFNTKIGYYTAERLFAILPCRLDNDFDEMVSRKKREALLNGAFKPLIGDLTGEWCARANSKPGSGSVMKLRAVFGEEAGRTVGKAVMTWPSTPGGALGGSGYVDKIELIPQHAEQRAGDYVIEYQEISRYRSGNHWSLTRTAEGWVLYGNDSFFPLKRSCDGFWKEGASSASSAGHVDGKVSLPEELRGEWCSGAVNGSSMQLRVAFNDDKGGFAGKATQAWGVPLGMPGYVIRSCIVPVSIDQRNPNPAIQFAVINGINSGAFWWARKSSKGWGLQAEHNSFDLSRECKGYWSEEIASPPGQDPGLSSLFDFHISEVSLPVPPHTPFTLKVSLKKDFNGTAKFFSCDKSRFMLLDIPNGEFVDNKTYNVHAKKGFIAKFHAEFLGDAAGSVPPVCAELSTARTGGEQRYYSELVNTQLLRLDKKDDWYSSHIMEALALDDPFALARTRKLLADHYLPEEVNSLLPGLAGWIAEHKYLPQAERAIKMIIGKYGGREAARALGTVLKSRIAEVQRKALELLSFCGQDGKEAAAAMDELLLTENNEEVLRDALLLASNWGLEIPPRLRKQDEISPGQAAAYKKEIKDVCDQAADVDLSRKEEYPRYYDDKGGRIPNPPDAAKAITRLRNLVKKMPDYPEMDRAYLLLGRLMKRFEDDYSETYDTTTHISGIPPEIADKMEEYIDGGPSGSYYYNGCHFDRLIAFFPGSEYVDEAAFEKTNLMQGGECEGDENCSLDYGVSRYIEFLKQYPASEQAGKAIAAINKEFSWILAKKSERLAGTRDFSIKGLEATIDSYQQAVQGVAPREKAEANDVICSLWLKTGNKEKAIAACNDILKNYRSYPLAAEIKARLEKIQSEVFEPVPPEGMGWFHQRFPGFDLHNDPGFTAETFTPLEYKSLIIASEAGDKDALSALKFSILKYLLENPGDGRYTAIKSELYSEDFLLAIDYADVADLLPPYLLENNPSLALAIVGKNPQHLALFPIRVRADKDVVTKAALADISVLKYSARALLSNPAFAIEFLDKKPGPFTLSYFPQEAMNSREFAVAVLKKHPEQFLAIDPYFREDPEVLPLIRSFILSTTAEIQIPDTLYYDRDFAKEVLAKNPIEIRYFSKDIQKDREIVVPLLKTNPELFKYAAKELQNDPAALPFIRAYILKTVTSDCSMLEKASDELRDDEEIIRAAVKFSPSCIFFASVRLQAKGLVQH